MRRGLATPGANEARTGTLYANAAKSSSKYANLRVWPCFWSMHLLLNSLLLCPDPDGLQKSSQTGAAMRPSSHPPFFQNALIARRSSRESPIHVSTPSLLERLARESTCVCFVSGCGGFGWHIQGAMGFHRVVGRSPCAVFIGTGHTNRTPSCQS